MVSNWSISPSLKHKSFFFWSSVFFARVPCVTWKFVGGSGLIFPPSESTGTRLICPWPCSKVSIPFMLQGPGNLIQTDSDNKGEQQCPVPWDKVNSWRVFCQGPVMLSRTKFLLISLLCLWSVNLALRLNFLKETEEVHAVGSGDPICTLHDPAGVGSHRLRMGTRTYNCWREMHFHW